MRDCVERAVGAVDAVSNTAGRGRLADGVPHDAQMLGLLSSGNGAEAWEVGERFLVDDASVAGDGDDSLAASLVLMGSLAWTEGRVVDALLLLRAAVKRGGGGELSDRVVRPAQTLAAALVAVGDFDGAEALLVGDRAEIDTAGNDEWVVGAGMARARLRLAQGRLVDSVAEAEDAIRAADESGARAFVQLAYLTVATAWLRQGDVARAAVVLDRCGREEPVAGGHLVAGLLAGVRSGLVAMRYGYAEAAAPLGDLYDNAYMYRRVFLEDPWLAPFMVRCALAANDRAGAEAIEVCTAQLAIDNGFHRSIGAIFLHARGVLHGDAASITQAARRHAHAWAQASACGDAAVVHAASGDRAGAHASLESALDIYGRSGISLDLETLQQRLGIGGAERGGRKRAAVPSGWGSLTDAEHVVAIEVARGFTNGQVAERMYRSRHTVDFHLRQVFLKLGIHSRVELARVAMTEEPLLLRD